jgi:hypothetical protein
MQTLETNTTYHTTLKTTQIWLQTKKSFQHTFGSTTGKISTIQNKNK